jgi:phenylpropionate dioxygenase-like ring-hydroxylating dioxygenase large terminal subunit
MEDRCVHRLAPLSLGRIEGNAIRCLYHGLLFDADGRCREIPGQDAIPGSACVRTYPAVERNNWIWVWMGDPDRADPARIAPSKALDDPAWVLKTGELHYRAHYSLINDNLLDLTHLAYVHAASFGADEAWSRNRPRVEPIAEGVRSSRWIVGTPPTPPLGRRRSMSGSISGHPTISCCPAYSCCTARCSRLAARRRSGTMHPGARAFAVRQFHQPGGDSHQRKHDELLLFLGAGGRARR